MIKCSCIDVLMKYFIGCFWSRLVYDYSIHSNFCYDMVNKLRLGKFEVTIFFREIYS